MGLALLAPRVPPSLTGKLIASERLREIAFFIALERIPNYNFKMKKYAAVLFG